MSQSIRKMYAADVDVKLVDGTVVTLRRMTPRQWTKLAQQIRDERIAAELKAIAVTKADPIMQQTLRMRADQFEPSYDSLVAFSQTPSGIERLLPFAAIQGGTDPALANELLDILSPVEIQRIMRDVAHAPLGPKVGGNLQEGQPANPTEAGSSGPATDAPDVKPGSQSPSSLTGNDSSSASAPSAESSPST